MIGPHEIGGAIQSRAATGAAEHSSHMAVAPDLFAASVNYATHETAHLNRLVAGQPEGPCFMRAVKGGIVIVDAENAHLLNGGVSVVQGTYSRHVRVYFNKRVSRLSRLIVDAPKGMVVDHINGDPLDNRRCNLRVCTVQQNNWNRARRPGGTSRFKGVIRAADGTWQAAIYPSGRSQYLGTFQTEQEAARAYDAAAIAAYGEFACLNFPDEQPRSAVLLSHNEVDRA